MPARLLRWRQDKTGAWWAEVTLYAPAGAVQQLPGEDYTRVPREPATPPQASADEYVIQKLPSGKLVLHRADCWAAEGHLTPVPPEVETLALRFDDTEPCDICQPAP